MAFAIAGIVADKGVIAAGLRERLLIGQSLDDAQVLFFIVATGPGLFEVFLKA